MDRMLEVPRNRRRPGRWRLPALVGLIVLFFLSLMPQARDAPTGPVAEPAVARP